MSTRLLSVMVPEEELKSTRQDFAPCKLQYTRRPNFSQELTPPLDSNLLNDMSVDLYLGLPRDLPVSQGDHEIIQARS